MLSSGNFPTLVPTIVVAGAGFSGTLTALQLLRQPDRPPLRIILAEKSGDFARGVAYAPPSDHFRLNVPFDVMGASPDAPGEFGEWLERRGYDTQSSIFVPRLWYGEYLEDLLKNPPRRYPEDSIRLLHDEVLDAVPIKGGLEVRFNRGDPIPARELVLAIGNLERTTFQIWNSGEYFERPFLPDTYRWLEGLREILVIGCGLTAVDFVLEAEASGFRGRFTMLSRHGRLPLVHGPERPLASPPDWTKKRSLRETVSLLAGEARTLDDSQALIRSIRPHLQNIWGGLTPGERRAFVTHVRQVWEPHRHRIPPESAAVLEQLRMTERLRVLKGRLLKLERFGREIIASIRLRGTKDKAETGRYDRAVLCAGIERDVTKCAVPVLRNLLDRELIRAGALRLGLEDQSGAKSEAARRIHVIGPLQAETRWEIVAVRELREEAARLAESICRKLR